MLTLIIGGKSAGKYEYLRGLGFAEDDFGADFSAPVLYKLNEYIKKIMDEGEDFSARFEAEFKEKKSCIIVCDEVGCGVVPISRTEREYREAVGRACVKIAKRADVVERVFCGIAARLKG